MSFLEPRPCHMCTALHGPSPGHFSSRQAEHLARPSPLPHYHPARRKGGQRARCCKVSERRVREICGILACQRLTVLKIADKYPPFVSLSNSELSQRLVVIKGCLPRCDVSDLVKAQPALFFGSPKDMLKAQIARSYDQLHQELSANVDIDELVQEAPGVLFQSTSSLTAALQNIRHLQLNHIEPADTARLLQIYNEHSQNSEPVAWLQSMLKPFAGLSGALLAFPDQVLRIDRAAQ